MPKLKFKSGDDWKAFCPWRVGDLLFSTTATNPNVEWPGTTWALYAQDRFPVGAGSGYALGATGGAATVTLSISQIPAHKHTVDYGNSVGASGIVCAASNTLGADSGSFLNNTGGGQSHENRPPYIAVNIWRRTA